MRQLVGIGTPRSLHDRAIARLRCIWSLIRLPDTLWDAIWRMYRLSMSLGNLLTLRDEASAGFLCPNRFHHRLAVKLRLKPTRNFAVSEAPLRCQQYLVGPHRAARTARPPSAAPSDRLRR